MSRQANRKTPKIISGCLYTADIFTTGTPVGSPAWFTWLETASAFYFEGRTGTFTAQRSHLGKGPQLTILRLDETALALSH